MNKNRIELDDVQPNAAAHLTEADIAHVTGGASSRQMNGIGYTTDVPFEAISLNFTKVEYGQYTTSRTC